MEEKQMILIVDDIPKNLNLLKQILNDQYTLRFANSGEAALEVAQKHKIDLILLDIMMPGMNGYEVCQKLKADSITAKIPVIFITARGEIEDESRGFDVGAVDYITKPVSSPIVLRRIQTHLQLVRIEELKKMSRSAIYMLGKAGHYNDDDTGVHVWRMASYAAAIARKSGWSKNEWQELELAAPMHDTGKIGIPDGILKAPRKLSEDEWKIMKTHSKIGHDILKESDTTLFQTAAAIALSHHERWDGTGYPQRLSGEAIPESARIVAIADVFDALTMVRPYKQAWPIEEALKEIKKSSASHLDPRLVKIFFSIETEIRNIKIKWDTQKE